MLSVVAPSAMDVSPTAKIKINPIMPAVLRTDELLTTAAFRGELERVREMLDHGAVCDARSERLTTALHWASSMGHLEVCALLIERGADTNARNATGETPLHVAAKEGDGETVDFLLDKGADPRLCNSAGRTALDLALEFADDEVELIDSLRQAQAQADSRFLGHVNGNGTDKPSRPKVQIVWESDLKAAAAAGEATEADLALLEQSRAVESSAPLDVSDGAGSSNGLEASSSSNSTTASISASALSSLADRLFAWDLATTKDDC